MLPADAPASITYAPTASELVAAFRARTWKPNTIVVLLRKPPCRGASHGIVKRGVFG